MKHYVWLLVWFCALLAPCEAAPSAVGEYQAKAAFLFNFPKYIEWPAHAFSSPSSPINVCVIGNDPFGPDLDSIHGKLSMGRMVSVRRIESINAAAACHILFISNTEEAQLKSMLHALRRYPVLLVSDMDSFAERGGMVHLLMENGRIKMAINLAAAQRQGLVIASPLLRLARIIRHEP